MAISNVNASRIRRELINILGGFRTVYMFKAFSKC